MNNFPCGSIGIKNLDRDVSVLELDLIHFISIYIATKFQLFPKFLLATIAIMCEKKIIWHFITY